MSVIRVLFVVAFRFVLVDANGAMFRGSRSHQLSGAGVRDGISDLLQELEGVMGRHQRIATEGRVERLEGALRPMFAALPKDSFGRVGSDGVRYLLHRLFVQRHGWFVNGLDAAGDAWNSSSPTGIFKEHAGEHVHGLFEEKLNSTGFDLHHTAVLAATLESLVHTDSIERLRVAYSLLGHSASDRSLTEQEVGNVIRAYMMMYVQNMDHNTVTKAQFEKTNSQILALYPTWPDTELFAREVRQAVLADVVGVERATWDNTLKVLEAIGEKYGRWQDKECRMLKRKLMEIERPGTGRVPLDKFYAGGLHDKFWHFLESVPYLRQAGALDESNPQQLSVIIPNYLNAPSNCKASSKFYEVCCIDECDTLLNTLEERIAAPEAPPALVAQLIAGLSSDTVQAPRILPASLVERLNEIAAHHGGSVRLHGRLFAQWMHHAYPSECGYPHLSGTTQPVPAEVYTKASGKSLISSRKEMKEIVEACKSSDCDADVYVNQDLPWSDHEELFVGRQHVPEPKSGAWSIVNRGLIGIAGFSSAAMVLLRVVASEANLKGSPLRKDHFV